MSFKPYVQTHRPRLKKHILSFLKKKKDTAYNLPFYKDVFDRLGQFIPRGKMLRGLFILLVAELYGSKDRDSTSHMPVAAAMEIVQSAFLIHDDIMDKDRLRRGEKTIYAQYEDKALHEQIPDALHYGQSMGLCVGDLAFFLAFELLTHVPESVPHHDRIIRTFVHEVESVSAAQMTDVHFGLSSDEPTLREIRTMYLRKTARYSFSLPFVLGALLAEAPEKDIKHLDRLGEYIGIAFQIRDDEIKLLGSADEVGTDIGSDIRENKKTLLRAWLLQQANRSDKQALRGIFGNTNLTDEDIVFVRSCIQKYDIPSNIEQEAYRLTKRAHSLVDTLSIAEDKKEILREVVGYVVSRKK
jgi:geranylgeranyl diphosphate synthase type I